MKKTDKKTLVFDEDSFSTVKDTIDKELTLKELKEIIEFYKATDATNPCLKDMEPFYLDENDKAAIQSFFDIVENKEECNTFFSNYYGRINTYEGIKIFEIRKKSIFRKIKDWIHEKLEEIHAFLSYCDQV